VDVRDRLAGVLVGTAIRDALGLPMEGMRAASHPLDLRSRHRADAATLLDGVRSRAGRGSREGALLGIGDFRAAHSRLRLAGRDERTQRKNASRGAQEARREGTLSATSLAFAALPRTLK
jgi:hypothetical protein